MKNYAKFYLIAAVLSAFLTISANACWVSITAINSSGTSQTYTIESQDYSGGFDYTNDESRQIALGNGIGYITKLKFSGKADPEIGAEFGVRAGSLDTTFIINSGLETFDALTNPGGYASAGVTLTDRLPTGTATITGLYAGGKINQARYNGTTGWVNLVDSFTISGTSFTNEEEYGNPANPITINDTLTSIESNFYFVLSAKDSASGTSNFTVIPEPATIILLGIASLALLRKRKP